MIELSKRGWRTIKRYKLLDIVGFILVIAGIFWIILRGAENQGYFWQWFRVPRYLYSFKNDEFTAGPILQGLKITLNITWISLILTYIIGLIIALLRLSDSLAARIVSRVYMEAARNTPLLVQLYFIYFVIAPILNIQRFTAAVLALSLFEGAYASEIYRAGIVSIHKGQWEAAYSLGLSTYNTYRRIILPQAIRRILPPLTSQAISLIKDSSLVSVLAVYEMTMQANAVVAETFLVFEIYFTIAAIYLIMTVTLSQIVNLMERRFKAYYT
ncbi:ABC transporter permease subunit [candidate division KSB3 bacterium]|uniref:ABC transporter permease subunit n=1 Tax=candidate division KSB3 bacterium TaxID=2044937 RepID=A0A9D5JUK0_9BACT|nr:ABC transporter permease subunit [candidate division KSB3 bacterium]MBD3324533.1 ABC transporter permease subunit [candidate division KSB3 bacterium]